MKIRTILTRWPVLLLGLYMGMSPSWAREVTMPEFSGIVAWFNTDKSLTKNNLKGNVVLIDFWTYSCINCIRTFPYVTEWHKKYAADGLVIVGVHTPEFEFEKDASNVKAALIKYGITYPVAMDNNYATWNAYSNRYWPAHYLFDRDGKLRYQHFGEGNYEQTENKIRELLAEGGFKINPPKAGVAEQKDFSKSQTPEIYLGYERLAALGNSGKVIPDKRQTFREPKSLSPHRFYLAGDWRIEKKRAVLESATGKILIRYDAVKANMVLDTLDTKEILAEVYIDGSPATEKNKGADVFIENGKALCRIREPRLYNLARTEGAGVHTLEIRFVQPHLRAYTFTFG